jgi:pyruvate/2-oxoglutarate dehydrogenase complex dihydrolipoamide dehydrogenase (E3) component
MSRHPQTRDGVHHADLCIIGAGSGGLSLAAGAVQMGASVILVERAEMGGDCLNAGCVPSKALLAAAKRRLPFAQAMAEVNRAIATIAPHDSQERFESLGCTVLRAEARFTSPTELEAGHQRIRARRFVIATGSRPVQPPIPGLGPCLTNETIFTLAEQPRHLAIIGGGPIGVEMAQAFARLASQVTLIEQGRLLSRDEPDAAGIIAAALRADGVSIHEHAKIARAEGSTLHTSAGPIEATHILAAAGRRPTLDALNLDAANIAHTDKGVVVDDGLRSTTNRAVFALGDAAGRGQFTHLAGWQAGIVLRRALFGLPASATPKALPWVTYTEPEVAQLGLTEAQARAEGHPVTVQTAPFESNDRAVAEGATTGRVKLVLGRGGKLLGASIIGPGAGELLAMPALAMEQGLGARALAGLLLPYPTRSEALKRAAGQHFTPTLFGPRTRWLTGLAQRWLP